MLTQRRYPAARAGLLPLLLLSLMTFSLPPASAADEADPYAWLEEITGAQALEWVKRQNAATDSRLLSQPDYPSLYRDALTVLNSASRLPTVEAHGPYLYDFWQDAMHPRGIYRRITPEGRHRETPTWETVLDLDDLAAREGKPWAFNGAIWRRPDETRCLILLSPGGGDAVEVREFDAEARAFVSGGFLVPTAKSRVAWAGADELYVGTDFGPGTMTAAGYPRIVKRWRRGTPLSEAQLVHEAPVGSVAVSSVVLGEGTQTVHLLTEMLTFWTAKFWQVDGAQAVPLAIPATAQVIEAFRGRLVIRLKETWTTNGNTFPEGSVVIVDPALLRDGKGSIDLVVAGTPNVVVENVNVTPAGIWVTLMDNVRGRLTRFAPVDGRWEQTPIALPDQGAIKRVNTHADTGEAWVDFESFTTPPTLYRVAPDGTEAEKIQAQVPSFDGERFVARQEWCTSADGTRVPYFIVGPRDLKHDGANPVWMFSYGGFENALTPSYSGSYEDLHGAYGKLWLERGGVFVLANIRGGGEFGPRWHQAALRENRYKAFEDFEAVARDLVTRKITSPPHLGIEGRSNGGLLVAATMLRHPELYGAVVCGNPLLDMRRYHRLLAGASWMAEFGDPDQPNDWAYLRTYSPYHNVRAGQALPPILFYTSTLDDRVHPGHARKMAARLDALGYAVDYYENTEGGHHGSVTSEQLANRLARTYAFLWAHCRPSPRKSAALGPRVITRSAATW